MDVKNFKEAVKNLLAPPIERKKEIVVNLLFDNIYTLSAQEKFLLWLSFVIRYIVMVIEATIVLVFITHAMYDSQILKLERQIEYQIKLIKNEQQLEQKVNYLHTFASNLSKLKTTRFSVYQYNEKLYYMIPEGVELKNVSFTGKAVSITGTAESFTAASALQENIKNAVEVKQDTLRISLDRRKDGTIEYEINFEFE